jgi:hypothetical protein
MLEHIVGGLQDKALYSTIFLNELSFSFDVDSHLREKLFEEAKRNGLVSAFSESQVMEEDGERERGHRSGGAVMQNTNLYDSYSSEFFGYNIDGFGNCLGAKKKPHLEQNL